MDQKLNITDKQMIFNLLKVLNYTHLEWVYALPKWDTWNAILNT